MYVCMYVVTSLALAQQLKRFIALVNFYGKFFPNVISYQMKLEQLIRGNKKNDRMLLKWDLNTEASEATLLGRNLRRWIWPFTRKN